MVMLGWKGSCVDIPVHHSSVHDWKEVPASSLTLEILKAAAGEI